MTVKRYWQMACDRCGYVHPHTFEGIPVAAALVTRLEPDGWRQQKTSRGDVRDLCPGCATAVLEKEEVA